MMVTCYMMAARGHEVMVHVICIDTAMGIGGDDWHDYGELVMDLILNMKNPQNGRVLAQCFHVPTVS